MKKFLVKAWALFDVEGEDENEAIEQASEQVRELKPVDFEYDVEEVNNE